MIRHYDMGTGEELGDENQDGLAFPRQQAAEAKSLRLLTVQEAARMQTPDTRLPADIADQAVDSILAKWS